VEGLGLPLEAVWYDPEKRIIYLDAHRTWSWQDAYDVLDHLHSLFGSVGYKVSLIVDAHALNWFLSNYGANINDLTKRLPENVGILVFITNQIVDDMFNAYRQLYGEHSFEYRQVKTIEEAVEVIRRYQSGKHWTSAPSAPNVN
jgi:hypothetical protein